MGPAAILVLAALACVLLWGPEPAGPDKPRAWPAGGGRRRASTDDAAGGAGKIRVGGVASVPLLLELLGAALDSGLTVQGALRVVANVADQGIREGLLRVVAGLEIGASWQSSWEGSLGRGDIASIHEALSFGALTGAPAAPILYAEAQQHRTAAGRLAESAPQHLGSGWSSPWGSVPCRPSLRWGLCPSWWPWFRRSRTVANRDSSTGRAGCRFIPHLPQVPFAPGPSPEELLQETWPLGRLRQ